MAMYIDGLENILRAHEEKRIGKLIGCGIRYKEYFTDLDANFYPKLVGSLFQENSEDGENSTIIEYVINKHTLLLKKYDYMKNEEKSIVYRILWHTMDYGLMDNADFEMDGE